MPRRRTQAEAAAGKLISSIQRVWTGELGDDQAKESEQVMYRAHELLQAAARGDVGLVLGLASVAEFLGPSWLQRHPEVAPSVAALEQAIVEDK